MSDDIWRDRRDDDDFSEFGSLFDDAAPTENIPEVAAPEQPDEGLSFDDSAAGNLPHWTEPPTGELPSFEAGESSAAADGHDPAHDELDVWSSFSSESPVWKDDETGDPEAAPVDRAPTGQQRRVADQHDRVSGQHRPGLGSAPAGHR